MIDFFKFIYGIPCWCKVNICLQNTFQWNLSFSYYYSLKLYFEVNFQRSGISHILYANRNTQLPHGIPVKFVYQTPGSSGFCSSKPLNVAHLVFFHFGFGFWYKVSLYSPGWLPIWDLPTSCSCLLGVECRSVSVGVYHHTGFLWRAL